MSHGKTGWLDGRIQFVFVMRESRLARFKGERVILEHQLQRADNLRRGRLAVGFECLDLPGPLDSIDVLL